MTRHIKGNPCRLVCDNVQHVSKGIHPKETKKVRMLPKEAYKARLVCDI